MTSAASNKRASDVQLKHNPNSLAEQAETIGQIWSKLATSASGKECSSHFVEDLPTKTILNYLVSEGLAAEREKARVVLHHFLGETFMNEGLVSIDEFKKLFQKGMFKQALMRIA